MPWRSRRPFQPPPASADYDIDPPLDEELPPTVDTNAWQAEPFPQDVQEREADQAEAEENPLPAECPLCACLDDPANVDPNSVAASILDYESQNFGRITDFVLFTQMADAYNERVWRPAFDRSMSNPHLQLAVPVRWTRLIVKRHFENCKHLTTRRRMARLLRQAEQLMDLSYQSVRVMNPISGEVKCDNAATKIWFSHAKAYSDMLIKSKPLLEAEGAGTASLAMQKPKDSTSDVAMFRSIMN